ncbi:MAG TPA: hypothetical protein VFU11_04990 [Solirubrobacterales bacterium]|nr:hypothetical protein [Solirubrobacterales bacterium]
MSSRREPIRSYQRIFRPERRIFQIEGRRLPIPGGVPLRWLAYATATLMAILVIGAGSSAVLLAAGAAAGVAGFRVGGRAAAVLASTIAVTGWLVGGFVLGLLDWPLRLVVLPAAVATLGTQATPDGRRADRFALSWLAIRLKPRRRSLGRGLPAAGRPHPLGGEVWVAPDERATSLRRGRVAGPALIFFSIPISLRRVGLRKGRLQARVGGSNTADSRRVVLGEREVLEVRP